MTLFGDDPAALAAQVAFLHILRVVAPILVFIATVLALLGVLRDSLTAPVASVAQHWRAILPTRYMSEVGSPAHFFCPSRVGDGENAVSPYATSAPVMR
jgi:hypothetical protein